jgi:hypothetical protein
VVRKEVSVPAGATPFNGSIDFALSCDSGAAHNGSITVANNLGTSSAITVPEGSQCTVTETLPAAPDGMAWAPPVYTQPGRIVAGQTATAIISNQLTRGTGDLARVPVNAPLALGGLAALIGMLAWRRQRAERQTKP